MNRNNTRVVLITGASSGIGRACAAHLHRRGYRVYGTSRRAPAAGGPAEGSSFQMMPMDVTDDDSVAQGVGLVLAAEGRVDVLVNNAGFGLAGPAEDTTSQEAQAQLETNFFGALRVCRAVLPAMRAQRGGTIVNVSSIGGLIGIPFQSLYSASKFALEGFSEALRMEVRPYGIRVVLIEPGDFRTGFTAHRCRAETAGPGCAYAEVFERALSVMETDETHGPAPERIARLLQRIIEARAPRLRYPVGPAAQQAAVVLKKVLPQWLFEWALMKYYRLD